MLQIRKWVDRCLKVAIDWIRSHSIEQFCSEYEKHGFTSIRTLSDCIWNLAVSNYQKIATCNKDVIHKFYDFTAQLYSLAADFRDIIPVDLLVQSDKEFTRLCRFLASAAWLLSFKQSNRDHAMESYLQNALESIKYLRGIASFFNLSFRNQAIIYSKA